MKTSLFLLLIGFCILFLSACEVSTGADTYTNGDSVSGSPGDYQSMAYQDAVNAGIPADSFVRQINQESGFNPNVVSSAGAIGIAQIMPSTAQAWNVDPHDPVASLRVAAQHMAWYQNTYGGFDKALAAYNGGVGRLVWAEQNCAYWLNCEWPETIRYVHAIMGD